MTTYPPPVAATESGWVARHRHAVHAYGLAKRAADADPTDMDLEDARRAALEAAGAVRAAMSAELILMLRLAAAEDPGLIRAVLIDAVKPLVAECVERLRDEVIDRVGALGGELAELQDVVAGLVAKAGGRG